MKTLNTAIIVIGASGFTPVMSAATAPTYAFVDEMPKARESIDGANYVITLTKVDDNVKDILIAQNKIDKVVLDAKANKAYLFVKANTMLERKDIETLLLTAGYELKEFKALEKKDDKAKETEPKKTEPKKTDEDGMKPKPEENK